MEIISQKLDEILATLSPLTVEWKDETALRVIQRLRDLPVKEIYTSEDVKALLSEDLEDGLLVCRLFLGLSKDQFQSLLQKLRGIAGIGAKAFRADPDAYVQDLLKTGLLEAVLRETNRIPHWSDAMVERLRSGRGSAISGQKRGRVVEDFAEAVVRSVFGDQFQSRCSFIGPRGTVAKCDFAIPSKGGARILIEAKGYGATGSKMTDILGDIRAIIAAKRPDTAFLFLTRAVQIRPGRLTAV